MKIKGHPDNINILTKSLILTLNDRTGTFVWIVLWFARLVRIWVVGRRCIVWTRTRRPVAIPGGKMRDWYAPEALS
jgi:hypothetical protein